MADGLGFFPPCIFGKQSCGTQTGSVKKQKNTWMKSPSSLRGRTANELFQYLFEFPSSEEVASHLASVFCRDLFLSWQFALKCLAQNSLHSLHTGFIDHLVQFLPDLPTVSPNSKVEGDSLRWRLGLFHLIPALRRLKWDQKFTKSIQRSRIKKRQGEDSRQRWRSWSQALSLLQPPANEDSGLTFPGGWLLIHFASPEEWCALCGGDPHCSESLSPRQALTYEKNIKQEMTHGLLLSMLPPLGIR